MLALPTALYAQETDPELVIRSWNDALNAGDVDTTLAFLADDAVLTRGRDIITYIVIKYVEAGTLKEKLGEPLPLDTIMDIISQVVGALDHAHKQGVIHRNVKPSNVLMSEGRWVLLGDFGLARMEGAAYGAISDSSLSNSSTVTATVREPWLSLSMSSLMRR